MQKDFVPLVNNNFVSHGVDRKTYIEISSEGRPAVFTVSKKDFIET